MEEISAYIGLDVHKETVSVADAGRDGEVRHLGSIRNTPEDIAKLARRLVRQHGTVEFVYEAGCCGYNIQRQLTELGLVCRICAPSMTPQKPGERRKNDTRDANMLARLHRAGELTFVWIPDPVHEALRDWSVLDTRHAAIFVVPASGFSTFCFAKICDTTARHGAIVIGCGFTTGASNSQPSRLRFRQCARTRGAPQSEARAQIREAFHQSRWATLISALQALKGVGPIVAATIVAEVGDFSRFAHPRQLVAYFGLAPGEYSSGGTVRPRGITKAGNPIARSILCEAAWNYRTTPKVGQ